MNISLIPDEYSHDPFTAFELGRKWGVKDYEIRYVYRWRVPTCPQWVTDRTVAAVEAYGVNVTAVSPGLFKPTMETDGSMIPISTDAPGEIRRHIDELLPRFFELAHRLGTGNVTVFALPKAKEAGDGDIPAIVIDALGEAAEQAVKADLQLRLENGSGSWADTGKATARILDAVGSDALKLTWDPANVAHGGFPEDPVAEGYSLVKNHVANVHVKDTVVEDGKGTWVMLGDGVIDWKNQVEELERDGYDGFLTVEPHLQYVSPVNLVGKMELFLSRLREVMA